MIILAIGFFFGAFLFNFNVGWGDPGAKAIRNILAVVGGVFLVIPIAQSIVSNMSDVGGALISGGLPLSLVGFFLGGLAMLMRKSSSEKTFNIAMRGAVILELMGLALYIIGAIISTKGGMQ